MRHVSQHAAATDGREGLALLEYRHSAGAATSHAACVFVMRLVVCVVYIPDP